MVNALSVIQVGIQHSLAFHVLTVLKVGRVPIEIDDGALVVGHSNRVDAAQIQQVETPHGIDVTNGVVSIKAETRTTVFKPDVLRHLERNTEFSVLHLYPSLIQHIFMIIHIGIGVRIFHSQFALLVEKLHPQFTVELGVQFTINIPNLALQSHHTHGMKCGRTLIGIQPIDSLQSDILFGECKPHGRVTQKQKRNILAFQWCRRRIITWIHLGHPDDVAKAQRASVTFPLIKHPHQSPT